MAKAGILIVEDERIIAMDIKHSLQNLGYEVVGIAASGNDAIARAGEVYPDLVLMDIMLQGEIDGIEAAEYIRQHYNIPFVYLTAYANDTILERAKVTQPFGYILKPFREKELVSNIEIALYRQKMEKKLQQREHWLISTLRSISDGVIAADVNGRVTFMNPVAESVTGWNLEEAGYHHIHEIFKIFNEVTRNPLDLINVSLMQNNFSSSPTIYLLLTKDGSEKIIDYRATPIVSDVGEIIGLIFLFRDVTEQRRTETEIAKADKVECISNLAGGIAQHFNDLLTVIWANIILASLDAHMQNIVMDRLAIAQKSCIEAQGLMQQLFTFSKDNRSIKKMVPIGKILRDIVRIYRNFNISLEPDIPENFKSVEIDSYQIYQVLNSIIKNAEEAMPQGGKITLKAENTIIPENSDAYIKAGKYIKISVKDEGVGISKDYLPKIYDPFFTTKKLGKGMGLTVAYNIIKKHGGYLTVESEQELGTTVSFFIPVMYSPDEPAFVTSDHLITGTGKILLMDDEEMILDVIGIMLEKLGYQVKMAKNGTEAVELFEQALSAGQPFDATILDWNVPFGLGGCETLGKLRELDPNVKAIISSGQADDPILSEFKKYGFCAILPKPYKITKLSTVLASLLGSNFN